MQTLAWSSGIFERAAIQEGYEAAERINKYIPFTRHTQMSSEAGRELKVHVEQLGRWGWMFSRQIRKAAELQSCQSISLWPCQSWSYTIANVMCLEATLDLWHCKAKPILEKINTVLGSLKCKPYTKGWHIRELTLYDSNISAAHLNQAVRWKSGSEKIKGLRIQCFTIPSAYYGCCKDRNTSELLTLHCTLPFH